MFGLAGRDNEYTDKGRWWVEDGRYCRQWTKWDGGRKSCATVVMEGKRLKFFDATGTRVGNMVLKK